MTEYRQIKYVFDVALLYYSYFRVTDYSKIGILITLLSHFVNVPTFNHQDFYVACSWFLSIIHILLFYVNHLCDCFLKLLA